MRRDSTSVATDLGPVGEASEHRSRSATPRRWRRKRSHRGARTTPRRAGHRSARSAPGLPPRRRCLHRLLRLLLPRLLLAHAILPSPSAPRWWVPTGRDSVVAPRLVIGARGGSIDGKFAPQRFGPSAFESSRRRNAAMSDDSRPGPDADAIACGAPPRGVGMSRARLAARPRLPRARVRAIEQGGRAKPRAARSMHWRQRSASRRGRSSTPASSNRAARRHGVSDHRTRIACCASTS